MIARVGWVGSGRWRGARWAAAFAAALVPGMLVGGPARAVSVEPVVLTLDPVPDGAPGERFSSFIELSEPDERIPVPVIDDEGRVAVWGRTSTQPRRERGVWRYDPDGTAVEIVRDPLPGGSESFTPRISSPAIADDGTVGVRLGPSEVALAATDGTVTSLPLAGSRGRGAPQLNAAFVATSGGAASRATGDLLPVPGAGDPAPGFPSGVTIRPLTARSLRINDEGEVALRSAASLSGVSFEEALWRVDPDGTARLLATTGGALPGESALVLPEVGGAPAIDRNGRIVFHGVIADNVGGVGSAVDDEGLWASERDGALRLLARTGDAVEGAFAGERIASIGDPVAVAGRVLFGGLLAGGPGPGPLPEGQAPTTLWRALFGSDDEGNIRLVARSGMTLPGFDGEVVKRITAPILGNRGDVVFTAFLTGGPDGRRVIVHQTPDGVSRVVLAVDEAVELAPGDTRLVRRFAYARGSDQDGQRALNDALELVVAARFDDGQGVLKIALPEPGGLALVSAGALGLALWGRRGRGWRRGGRATP